DYESEAGYQAQVVDFARRRGMDHAADIAAGMEERVGRRLSWIGAQRERVAELWQRASVALGFAIEKERSVSYDDYPVRRANLSVQVASVSDRPRYLLPPQEYFARSLEDNARSEHLASARWKEREKILLPVLDRIYRDPAAALARLNERASAWEVDPRRLGQDLMRDPSRLGIMRGSGSLNEGQAARKARAVAVAAAAELGPLARSQAERFKRDQSHFENREYARRSAMSLPVPALSPLAVERLKEIEAVREKGGEGAYKTA